jgi:hypothetical protein
MLFALPVTGASGNDKTESRSECLVSLLFSPKPLLRGLDPLSLKYDVFEVLEVLDVFWVTVVWVTVVCESSENVSVRDEEGIKVSTEAIVERRCCPVVGRSHCPLVLHRFESERFGEGQSDVLSVR